MSAQRQRSRLLSLLLAFLLATTACAVAVDPVEVAIVAEAIRQEPATAGAGDLSTSELDRPDKGVKADAFEQAQSLPANVDEGPSGSTTAPSAPAAIDEPQPDDAIDEPVFETEVRPAEVDQPLSRESSPDPTPTPTPDPTQNPFADPVAGGGIDFRLTRDDVDCEEDQLSAYDFTPFVVAHVVVDGNLGAPCFGTSDPRLIEAWQVLASITPPGQLHDIGLFGGYVSLEEGETTLGFVNTLDYEGTLYQMSINLDEAEADPDELRLTMAHEFTHIFTSLSTQLDRFVLPRECQTWDNGEGCYRQDSLMWDWIQRFWGAGLLDQIDPYEAPTTEGGQNRCDLDSGFLGPYSASSPEEDFAESFSAYVFRLNVDTPGLQAKMEWFDRQPGLVEFRELAIAAGYEPQRNYFEPCG